MTSPPPFVEFSQNEAAILQIRGELRGVLNVIESLLAKIAALDAGLTRALDQAESVNRRAATLTAAAQARIALQTADRDSVLAELAALRAEARAALRDPAKP